MVALLDEVGNDLGVGFGAELVALMLELLLELGEVLDDAVVDHHDLAIAIPVRVGIQGGGLAVGGPARVPDPHPSGQLGLGGHLPLQVGNLAGGLDHARGRPLGEDGDPSGVVAAVFQALQGLKDYRRGLPLADVADDAAHSGCPHVNDGYGKGERYHP